MPSPAAPLVGPVTILFGWSLVAYGPALLQSWTSADSLLTYVRDAEKGSAYHVELCESLSRLLSKSSESSHSPSGHDCDPAPGTDRLNHTGFTPLATLLDLGFSWELCYISWLLVVSVALGWLVCDCCLSQQKLHHTYPPVPTWATVTRTRLGLDPEPDPRHKFFLIFGMPPQQWIRHAPPALVLRRPVVRKILVHDIDRYGEARLISPVDSGIAAVILRFKSDAASGAGPIKVGQSSRSTDCTAEEARGKCQTCTYSSHVDNLRRLNILRNTIRSTAK